MLKIFSLAIGGIIGTLLRYSIVETINRSIEGSLFWGSLVVNLTGSFIIGILLGIFEMQTISQNLRIFLCVGLLGSFTTFSAFTSEGFILLKSGKIGVALLYFLISNIIGILLVYLGFLLSKKIPVFS